MFLFTSVNQTWSTFTALLNLVWTTSYAWVPLQTERKGLRTNLTGHNIKWDHFEILATGRSDIHCRIKESLLIKDLKPSLNANVGSEKLFLYYLFIYFPADFDRSVYYQFFAIVLIRFQSFALAFKSCCILSNRHFWGCIAWFQTVKV